MDLSDLPKCKNRCCSGDLFSQACPCEKHIQLFADATASKKKFQNPCGLPHTEKQIYFATYAVHLRSKQK